MNKDKKILEALIKANKISQDKKLKFEEKMQAVLMEIVSCMSTKKGSIMVVKGRSSLEVTASTNPNIIGMKQTLNSDSPSSWVVKN